jgi:hypothetical protein
MGIHRPGSPLNNSVSIHSNVLPKTMINRQTKNEYVLSDIKSFSSKGTDTSKPRQLWTY